jgi:hypothetical protein
MAKLDSDRLTSVTAAVMGLAALAACSGPPEEFQREVELICTTLGYQPGTPDYVNCLQTNHARGRKACQNCLPGAEW